MVIERIVWLCDEHEHYGSATSVVTETRGHGCYYCLGDSNVVARMIEVWVDKGE